MLTNFIFMHHNILGMIGIQKGVHMRYRVAVDDMIHNGVKPWILSHEDHKTMMVGMNSLRILQNCHHIIEINAVRETEVMDQLQNGLRLLTDIKSG